MSETTSTSLPALTPKNILDAIAWSEQLVALAQAGPYPLNNEVINVARVLLDYRERHKTNVTLTDAADAMISQKEREIANFSEALKAIQKIVNDHV